MLDHLMKTIIFSCITLFGARVLLPDLFDNMDGRKLLALSVGLLIIVGAGILAYRRFVENAKNHSAHS
ncbi:MAG: hypothetical protein M0042_14275 [Nitrospiraceae bacterium]|nr:hypothetical protein [Nitrospiraceae bacterium]